MKRLALFLALALAFAPLAHASDLLPLVGATMKRPAAAVASGVTFTATDGRGGDNVFGSGNITETNVAIGNSTGRVVYIAFLDGAGRTTTSPTITPNGGSPITLTEVENYLDFYHIYTASLPDGATLATISFTGSAAYGCYGISVGILLNTVTLTPTQIALHPFDFVGDPQVIPRADQSPNTLTIGATSVAVIFGGVTSTTTQTPTWTGAGVTRDATGEVHVATGNGVQTALAHTSTNGAVASVSGSSGNGYGFNAFSGIATVFGP